MADHGDEKMNGGMPMKEEMMPMPEGMVCCADGTYEHAKPMGGSGDRMPSEQKTKPSKMSGMA